MRIFEEKYVGANYDLEIDGAEPSECNQCKNCLCMLI